MKNDVQKLQVNQQKAHDMLGKFIYRLRQQESLNKALVIAHLELIQGWLNHGLHIGVSEDDTKEALLINRYLDGGFLEIEEIRYLEERGYLYFSGGMPVPTRKCIEIITKL